MINTMHFKSDMVEIPKKYIPKQKKNLENILGIDSEAYDTGDPFMFCCSDGRTIIPEDFFDVMLTYYLGTNFMVFNLKYDSGAFLYHVPRPVLQELREFNEAEYMHPRHGKIKLMYLPGKILKITFGRHRINFWDISQFYKMSLDNASKRYLGEGKIEVETKTFTRKYVQRFWEKIARYCIKDAQLTARLGELIVEKLNVFDIVVPSLYSCASISYLYFDSHSKISTVHKFGTYNRKIVEMACDAYAGGKFEVTQRGTFYGYEYDITSAYPYEIQNLVDLSGCRVRYNKSFEPEAIYSFYRVEIWHYSPDIHLPFGVKIDKKGQQSFDANAGTVVYPMGHYFVTITKNELLYLMELGVKFKIYDAGHIFYTSTRKRKVYPYRSCIKKLFKIKADSKGKDPMIYMNSKTIMNSFYGKLCQCVYDKKEGVYRVGPAFNPIYASVITANTRLAVTRLQNLMGKDCVAVHTDSVMTKRPIPKKFIKDRLGYFEYVTEGTMTTVLCGCYQIGEDIMGEKGIRFKEGDNWRKVFERFPDASKIPFKKLHVESWVEALAKGHPTSVINRFDEREKFLDLNSDVKRLWQRKVTAKDLLQEPEYGPPIVFQNDRPKFW